MLTENTPKTERNITSRPIHLRIDTFKTVMKLSLLRAFELEERQTADDTILFLLNFYNTNKQKAEVVDQTPAYNFTDESKGYSNL